MTRSVAWLPLLCLTLLSCPALAGGGPENVLVLANDASSESLEVAHYYMHRRGVPRHHIVHLNLDKKHWGYIRPFSTYLTEVEQPVKAWLAANKSSHITTLVLSRDVPVTVELIMPEPRPKKLRDRNRSVAHMLAVMDVDRAEFRQAGKSWRRSGNPYNGRDRSIDFRQPLDLPLQKYALYCAGTINAFSVSDSKKLVDRAIASERERPTGTVYLSQSRAKDPRGCYNKHFPTLAKILEEWGFKSEVIPHPGKSKALLTGKQDVLAYQYGQAGWAKTFPGQNTYALGALVDNVTSVALTSGCFNPKRKGGQTSM